ncbi:MAG: trypsin-like peptidase domain-containing protein [Planctomycetes bacterium]|nr:trypsin-like peptidase domain-containing protein [Planctomycetota bacterium]
MTSALSMASGQETALDRVLAAEKARLEVVKRVEPAVACVFRAGGEGGGSGVVVSPDGYCLTNFHVTEMNREMEVGLSDGKRYRAIVVGIDPTGDIALMRLTGKDVWSYAPLGDSNDLSVGDQAIAMGNPFLLAKDYKPTVTLGIVTGLHRHLAGSGNFNLVYSDCIQIDTSINPGNSGGPLFNLRGEVIGINGRMTVRDRGRVNTGIGFAVSANQIKNFLPALRHGEMAQHGLLDATVRLDPDGRIVFDQMFEDSPAYEAGVRLGDELESFDGVEIDTVNRFANLIYTLPAGKTVEIVYRREGVVQTTRCVLKGIPSGPAEKDVNWTGAPEGHLAWELDRTLHLSRASAGRLDSPAATGRLEASGVRSTPEGDAEFRATFEGLAPQELQIGGETFRFQKFSVERVAADGSAVEIPAADAGRLRRLLSIGGARELATAREDFASVEFAGAGWDGNTPCVLVEGRRASGHRVRWVVDEQDHRIRRVEFLDAGGRIEASLALADERIVEGAVLHSRTVLTEGERTVSFRFDAFGRDGTNLAAEPCRGDDLVPLGNPYRAVLAGIWSSVLKVYGQGHVRGIPAQGSAVMVDAEKGLAVTNLTIMLKTPRLYVVDGEGREWRASVVREDEKRLLALIELQPVEGRTFPPALPPAASAHVRVGDLVLSVGNAEDLAADRELPTANLGIVTAVTMLAARAGIQDFDYKGPVFINDSKVNPGAYGGPVVDMQGRWIGLNAKIVEAKATNTQITYTIPMDAMLDFLPGHEGAAIGPEVRDPRPVHHGIVLFDANPLRSGPAYVDRTLPGSPAAKAGLRPDDLVLRADDVRIKTCRELEDFFKGCHPGQTVRLSVKRGSQVIQVEIALVAKEE